MLSSLESVSSKDMLDGNKVERFFGLPLPPPGIKRAPATVCCGQLGHVRLESFICDPGLGVNDADEDVSEDRVMPSLTKKWLALGAS